MGINVLLLYQKSSPGTQIKGQLSNPIHLKKKGYKQNN